MGAVVNLACPFGLRAVTQTTGGSIARAYPYALPENYDRDVFIGDIVKLNGNADSTARYPEVVLWEKGDTGGLDHIIGVVDGFVTEYEPENGMFNRGHFAPGAGTATMKYASKGATQRQYVRVITDPNALFEVRVDSTDPITADMVGSNVDVTARNPVNQTSYPVPGFGLDPASVATGVDLPLTIVKGVPRLDNNATASYGAWHVMFNRHSRKGISAGV